MCRTVPARCYHTSSVRVFPGLVDDAIMEGCCRIEVVRRLVLSFCFQSGELGCSLAKEQSCSDSQSAVIRLLAVSATLTAQTKWVSWLEGACLRLRFLPR